MNESRINKVLLQFQSIKSDSVYGLADVWLVPYIIMQLCILTRIGCTCIEGNMHTFILHTHLAYFIDFKFVYVTSHSSISLHCGFLSQKVVSLLHNVVTSLLQPCHHHACSKQSSYNLITTICDRACKNQTLSTKNHQFFHICSIITYKLFILTQLNLCHYG